MSEIDPTARPKSVGASVVRTEDPRLLAGQGKFVDDRNAPGLLHVAFRRSDHAHAVIGSIDCKAAKALPGVVAVLTAADLGAEVAPVHATSKMKGYYATPILPLAQGKVRYVGEPVVAVIAQSRYLAEDAAELIEIDYQPLTALVDPEAAALADAVLVHEAAGTNVIVAREFRRGEVEARMASAHIRVKARFRMRRKTPGAIENRAAMADYDAGRDEITLHSTTQVPGIIRNAIAEALGMSGAQVRVVAPEVGGGFGAKASLYPEELLVAAAARRLGRAVKWSSDRLEDLIATSQGFDEVIDAEVGIDPDGRILALDASVTGDVGAFSIYPWTAGLEPVQVVSFLPGPYKIDTYRGAVKAVATNKAPMGPYRGVGRPVSTFVMERLIDKAAAKLGIDAREMRRRNLVADHEFPYKAASGLVWDKSSFTGCLDAVCDKIGYDDFRQTQAVARAKGEWIGIGLASYAELTGIGSRISVAPGMPINTGTETAKITIDAMGGITAAFGIASHGQGLETTLAQVVGDHLGVPHTAVRVIQGDSGVLPNATGTYASRSTVLAGGAAILASETLKAKVVAVAAHMLEAAPADLKAEAGLITIVGTDRRVSFKDVARAVYLEMGRLPEALRDELTATRTYDPVFGTTSAAAHAAIVRIDPATYAVRVEAYAVAEDCGKLINPMIVDGQVHGGVAQGIGAALSEEVVYNEDGQILTASLVDYVMPTAAEIPPIWVVHLETPAPTLGGYRGMGEGGTIGAPAAVANAVADALAPLGVDVDDLPVTPERLYRLIEAAKARSGTKSR